MKKEGTGPGARGYQGIVYAITFARELRRRGVTCSQRELYYNYKGDGESPWRTQAECNESIADAAAIFGRPRFALGFTTAPRGMAHPWVAGRRDWLDEIQAQLDKDFKCELEAMALAPPRERGRGKLSFQNLSHFVEEAIVARDWLE